MFDQVSRLFRLTIYPSQQIPFVVPDSVTLPLKHSIGIMAACQDYTCGGYEDVEEWADEIQQFATGGVTSSASNLPTVLAKCQEAVQPTVSPCFNR